MDKRVRRIIKIAVFLLCICLAVGFGAFFYNAEHDYRINSKFTPIPLDFDPDTSQSAYTFNGADVVVHGGFVKGIQKDAKGQDNLLIRALSPLPSVKVASTGDSAVSIDIMIENLNPDSYAASISGSALNVTRLKAGTLHITVDVPEGQKISIDPVRPDPASPALNERYVVLGDNRDGYDTFQQIIKQVNGFDPVFVIDNGDLVFSGKPNQYRLFDRIISDFETTVCTTLGNHDIRDGGRETYTMLYGPPYYSFDYGVSHFIFLDSSRGWAEVRAITDEQYEWLERDLKKAREQNKTIYVVSHIPSFDPRTDKVENEIPNYVSRMKSGNGWLEEKLNNYNANKDMDYGFQDPAERARFEGLMSMYRVDTVYLSHIHNYLEYRSGGVRYIITGGAGAELLMLNTYYHYMIAQFGSSTMTMVELPSPPNAYVTRYRAAISLFTDAMSKENPTAMVFLSTGFVLLLFLLITMIYFRRKRAIDKFWNWVSDSIRYSAKQFRLAYFKKHRH